MNGKISKKRLEKLIEVDLEISRILNNLKEPFADRCSLILKKLDKVIPYKQSGIFLLDEDTDEISAIATRNYDKETAELIYSTGKGFIGRAVETGETLYAPDLHKKWDKSKVKPIFLDRGVTYEKANSSLVIPIKTRGKPVGVLEVISEKKDAFSNIDIEVMKIATYQIAPWIEIMKLIKNRHLEFGKDTYTYLESQHPYLKGHAKRVTKRSCEIAEVIGLNKIFIKKLNLAGQWHDIGKVKIRDDTLDSEEAFTPEENPVKAHSEKGYHLMLEYGANPAQDRILLNVIRLHHEHYDGSGYPLGLKGENIPLEARIVFIADVADALTSKRPYRKARGEPEKYTLKESVEIMKKMEPQFDSRLLDVYFKEVYPKLLDKKV
ncbi:MAG: HD domain-containing protein [Candidatus Pacearchaeota archaeon]|nr:MAG: HD domain-containing protein [Candidatus Pacearchaeota archaeon]